MPRIVASITLFLITLTCNRVPLHNFGECKLRSNIIRTPTLSCRLYRGKPAKLSELKNSCG